MRWLAATNLLPDSDGVLQFVASVRQLQSQPDANRFAALTIAREGDYFTGGDALLERVVAGLRRAQARTIADGPAPDAFETLDVRNARSVARALTQAAGQQARGLVAGRSAKMRGGGFIRLGATARRIIRRMTTPVCIVPPDWRASEAGAGPVVVAADPSEASVAAADFARHFAASIAREVLLVHAVPGVEAEVAGVAFTRTPEFRNRQREAQLDAFRAFIGAHGLAELPTAMVSGSAAPALNRQANEADAYAIVCGSRQLSAAERIFSASVGSELAATGPRPTLIVPPDWTP